MLALDAFVPGFDHALDRTPGARPAWRVLNENVAGSPLGDRAAALVHLAVAHQSGGDYARWAVGRHAARQGLTGEDMLLASAGTAIDGREAAIVRAAREMAAHARFADTDGYRRLERVTGSEAALHILSHVALALLAIDVLDRLAPRAAPARKGA